MSGITCLDPPAPPPPYSVTLDTHLLLSHTVAIITPLVSIL